MGNQRNSRNRLPRAKKSAEIDSDSPPSSHRASTRPKPKPTGAAAIKDPKPSRPSRTAEASDQAQFSKKVRSVTWADGDASMVDDTGEDEVIQVDEDEDETWNDLPEDDEEEVEDVMEVKRHNTTAYLPAKKEIFQIPFEVSVNGRLKEMSIPYDASWEAAQILIGKKMLRVPEALSLGYINPFKPRGTGKLVPSSLENEEEWNGLVQHVEMFLKRESAKNRGKGGMTKPWAITLVDMGKDASRVASKTTAKGSKMKQLKEESNNNHDDNNDTGSDSQTLADICNRHHCDRCGKACYIDPGPPPTHKPFTMEQLSVWTSLVKLKAATIDQVPEALHLPKRRDRIAQAMPVQPNPSHIAANTMTTSSTATNSQGYTHSGFAMPGFPPFSTPAFPMQTYPYPMPTPMYAPYSYQFAPQGAHAMQPNGYPAPPFMMPNYPMPNYPLPAPMYPPPSSYPFAMPAPQDADVSYGRKRQCSVSNAQATSSSYQVDGAIVPDTDLSVAEWIAASAGEQDTPEP